MDLTNLTAIAGKRNLIRDRLYYGYLTSLLSEKYFFKLLESLNIDLLIECGANAAETSQKFTKDKNKNAIAVEANPVTYSNVTALIQSNNIVTLCNALSDETGMMTLKVPITNDPTNGASSLHFRNDEAEYNTYQCEKTTIDIIMDSKNPFSKNSNTALWIDVEGHAYNALVGASKTLEHANTKLIYVEVETKQFWENQKLASEIIRFLKKFNFTPVIRDLQTEDQFNLVFIKDNLVDITDEIILKYWQEFADIGSKFEFIIRSYWRFIKFNLLQNFFPNK